MHFDLKSFGLNQTVVEWGGDVTDDASYML